MSDFDIDAILAIETAASKRGEEAGIVEGHAAAVEDGRNLGIMKAWEVGIEIGFYSGACKYLLENPPASLEVEKQNKLRAMCEGVVRLCREFPRVNDSGVGGGGGGGGGGTRQGNSDKDKNSDVGGDNDKDKDGNNDSGGGREAGEVTHKLQIIRSKFKVICRRIELKSPLDLKEIFGESMAGKGKPKAGSEALANLGENAEGELF
ncbi:hypothetical protein TrVE_jg6694 [Triparma verrucosa]|uniref:Essential protein Yae1 N-terminal domain-containing protein n=1 Tax=Triparma verrucosa TaxID=1606542 RepID=A0A9W7CP95_9STRA|nr:hypothetical protein TrVE_jg6694 [Triparma verrucosa]